ncbi:MAG: RNA polymerase sigma factor, partial [Acidobacteriota bacterium]|nr:RNA polymerase sigma factor [Acidobacteriota bacterium]
LRTITARKALDGLRQLGRRAEQPLPGPDAGTIRAQAGDPDATLDVLTVRHALGRLAATDRAVLTLVDLEGWSMAEAARALGVTRVAAKLRAVRARRKLARLLAERPQDTR